MSLNYIFFILKNVEISFDYVVFKKAQVNSPDNCIKRRNRLQAILKLLQNLKLQCLKTINNYAK